MSLDFDKFWSDVKDFLFTKPDEDLNFKSELELFNRKEIEDEVKKMSDNETTWERVEKLFQNTESNLELREFNEQVFRLFMVGTIIGGANYAASTADNFKRANQLTVYSNSKDATRSFVQYVFVSTVKGGLKWGIKFAAFGGMGLGIAMILTAYRNKSSPVNYAVGLATTGALFRMHYGLKNFVFAGVYGGILGGLYGTATYLNRKYSNNLYEDFKFKEFAKRAIDIKKLEQMMVSDPKK